MFGVFVQSFYKHAITETCDVKIVFYPVKVKYIDMAIVSFMLL